MLSGGREILDPGTLADVLNGHFVGFTSDLSHLNWNNRISPLANSLYLTEITEVEVAHAIESLKHKATLDIFGISNKLVKLISKTIEKPFTNIMSAVFDQTIFSERAKLCESNSSI